MGYDMPLPPEIEENPTKRKKLTHTQTTPIENVRDIINQYNKIIWIF